MNPLTTADEVDRPWTTKEGWSRFVTEHPDPPIMLSPAALQQLTDDQRLQYDTAREHYHARLVIVSTPTIRHVAATGRKRITLNRYQHSARRGLIVTGCRGTRESAQPRTDERAQVLGARGAGWMRLRPV